MPLRVKLLFKKIIIIIRKQVYIIQDIFFSSKQKIVIYTAIFGKKDDLIEPKYKPKNCVFVCFTDQDFKSDTWQIRKVAPEYKDPVRAAKIFKILPHKYFPKYKYSIWIDGNMLARGNVNILLKYLKSTNMAAYNHMGSNDAWDCIYEEARQCIRLTKKGSYKEEPALMQKQADHYREQGYPKHNGLITGMILVRKHNEPDVVKTMEDWWREIEKWSRRDQLSFNYTAWKNYFKFTYIPGDSRNNEFFKHNYHLK